MRDKLGPIDIEFVLDRQAEENAKSLREALDSIAKSNTGALKTVEQAMKELIEAEKELLEVEKQLENTGPGAEKDAMLDFIRVSKETIAQEKANLEELQQVMSNTVAGTETLTGSISKWILTLGGASAALALLKREFLETTQGMNLFSNVGAGVKQVLQDFVSTGGVNINNVREAVSVQRELNRLRLENYRESLAVAKYNLEYERLYSESLDASLSKSEKIKTINSALSAHNKAIDLQIKNTRDQIAATNRLLAIRPNNEKILKELYDLNIEIKTLEAQRYEGTKRLTRSLSELFNDQFNDIRDLNKKIQDELQEAIDKDLEMEKKLRGEITIARLSGRDKELEVLKQQYQQDIETWKQNEDIKTLLTEKYLIERDQIVKRYAREELERLKNENQKVLSEILRLDPGKGYAILGRAIKNWSNVIGPGINQLKPTNQSREKIDAQIEKNINDELEKQAELRHDIAAAAGDLLTTLGQTLGMDNEAASFLQNLSSAIQGALEGDYLGLISTALNTIFSIIPNKASDFNRQLDRMNTLIEEQDKLLQKSYREGGTDEAFKETIDSLETAIKNIEKWIGPYGVDLLIKFGRIAYNFVLAIPGISREMLDEWFRLNEQLDIARQKQKDFLAGDVIQNDISDAVSSGFIEGGIAGVDSVAAYMEDVLKEAAQNVFRNEIMGEQITGWVDQMRKALDDKKLSQAEKDALMETARRMAEDYQVLWDNLMGVFPGEEVSDNSLTGAIKGISEQTASVVAGQMNAMRINQVQGLDMIRQQMISLAEIASNTRYNKHLESIDSKMDALQSDNIRASGIL